MTHSRADMAQTEEGGGYRVLPEDAIEPSAVLELGISLVDCNLFATTFRLQGSGSEV